MGALGATSSRSGEREKEKFNQFIDQTSIPCHFFFSNKTSYDVHLNLKDCLEAQGDDI